MSRFSCAFLMVFTMLFVGSCSFADALDGHIDQADHCCAAVLKDRIEACLAKFTEPMHCKVATCAGRTSFACRLPDGELADHWTGDGDPP